MKLVANLKLTPTAAQHEALLETLKVTNRACTWLAGQAWETQTFGQFALHKLTYERCRVQFGLAAQMTVRCIAKVADTYKLDRKTRRRFRRYAAQPYDDRIFRLCSDTHLSLWTVHGRLTMPYQCGKRQRVLLAYRKGEVDLMYIKGVFYLQGGVGGCAGDPGGPQAYEPAVQRMRTYRQGQSSNPRSFLLPPLWLYDTCGFQRRSEHQKSRRSQSAYGSAAALASAGTGVSQL
jgi:hypothetical protein